MITDDYFPFQEEPLHPKSEALIADAPKKDDTKEIETNNIDNDSDNSESSDSNSSSESEEDEKIHVPMRLPMDLEELAGALLEKNQKTKMNCIVEKKKAEEVVDHQSKTITLPFGVNLTTDPRYEKLSGERMVIVCESGTFQRYCLNFRSTHGIVYLTIIAQILLWYTPFTFSYIFLLVDSSRISYSQ